MKQREDHAGSQITPSRKPVLLMYYKDKEKYNLTAERITVKYQ